jgi:hypothetical protein
VKIKEHVILSVKNTCKSTLKVVSIEKTSTRLSIAMNKDSRIMTIAGLALLIGSTLAIIVFGYFHGSMHLEAVLKNLRT